MNTAMSTDPRTGTARPAAPECTSDDVDRIAAAAAAAAPGLATMGRTGRAELLRAAAAELERHAERIVATADQETALGPTRLTGELTRTTYQLRMFADVLEDGAYLEATIDHATTTPMGPAPDLRRMLVPLGPVAVFGASNFPLAFSVPGGDTASALAAGCPVVVKAHPSHPRTSRLTFDALAAAAARTSAPEGTLGIVFGERAGADLVANRHITAVGYTGSPAGASALQRIIGERPDPVPFYGELSSLNPVVVTETAAAARRDEIADGLVSSFTTAAGQLCTKPGLAFVPASPAGDALVARMTELVRAAPTAHLLNERIHTAFHDIAGGIATHDSVTTLAPPTAPAGPGFVATPALLMTPATALTEAITTECFGPLLIVVRRHTIAELRTALSRLPGSLTATIHTGQDEQVADLVAVLAPLTGRLVFNGYPTGVVVSWAQHHGGPWPATNSLHTSVGPTAIRRFLRPFTWQNAPVGVLPPELRDDQELVPRRVDGVLVLPRRTAATGVPG